MSAAQKRQTLRAMVAARDVEGLLWWVVAEHETALATRRRPPSLPVTPLLLRTLEMLVQLEKRREPLPRPQEKEDDAAVEERENVLRRLLSTERQGTPTCHPNG